MANNRRSRSSLAAAGVAALVLIAAVIQAFEWMLGGLAQSASDALGLRGTDPLVETPVDATRPEAGAAEPAIVVADHDPWDGPCIDDIEAALHDLRQRAA